MNIVLVGSRGLVGQTLLTRCADDAVSFQLASVSQAGKPIADRNGVYLNAMDIGTLQAADIVVTTQGSDYTQAIYPELRNSGWQGYWLDAASYLRDSPDALLVLDPINGDAIDQALANGVKTFVGANCTVSLQLMALGGLWQSDMIDWASCMTYQAVSGAGSATMRQLLGEQQILNGHALHERLPLANDAFAMNVLPWIDGDLKQGVSKEECKGHSETAKLLGRAVNIDSICVRVPVWRCHSQAITLKVKRELNNQQLIHMIEQTSQWTYVVDNTREATLQQLTPQAVSNTLNIHVGRIRQCQFDPLMWQLFTVGDQLLWGAAEPLRRMLGRLI